MVESGGAGGLGGASDGWAKEDGAGKEPSDLLIGLIPHVADDRLEVALLKVPEVEENSDGDSDMGESLSEKLADGAAIVDRDEGEVDARSRDPGAVDHSSHDVGSELVLEVVAGRLRAKRRSVGVEGMSKRTHPGHSEVVLVNSRDDAACEGCIARSSRGRGEKLLANLDEVIDGETGCCE